MEDDFEDIYKWTNERIKKEVSSLKELKRDTRQIEGLIIILVLVCIIISLYAEAQMAKYIFITVAVLMFIFCTIYSFKNESKIIDKQNQFSEVVLAELAVHIKDGFTYEENEEVSGNYYIKSGFNRIYKELKSKGVISGTRNNHSISVSNIIVKGQKSELFKGIFAYVTLNKEVDEIDIMTVNSKNNKKEKFEIPDQKLYLYAEDVGKARELITDEVLDELKKFRQKINLKFELMMNKNLLFFRFFDNEILTKPLSNNKQTKEYVYKYYQIIEFLAYIAEIIDK